jgi:carbamoyl-phosphate synthase small subunit
MMMDAVLTLENGTIFRGKAFGARTSLCGEVCFNTSMTGYQEILTDPSYKAQIVTMTCPLIGNYGVNKVDIESYKPHLSGFVVRELSPIVSSWRADTDLDTYLKENGIPGIEGIDTRALTKRLRVEGAMNGFLSTEDISDTDALEKAKNWPGLAGIDYVKEVTIKKLLSGTKMMSKVLIFVCSMTTRRETLEQPHTHCLMPTSILWLWISG